MTEISMFKHLESITEKLGVELRYENLNVSWVRSDGGFCRVSGKPMILINRNDSRRRKILILAKSLKIVKLGRYIHSARGSQAD